MHYQFIMGNDLRASYDYYLLTCGPVALADWAGAPDEVFHAFSRDSAYVRAVPSAALG
jgi:hypothetical protein